MQIVALVKIQSYFFESLLVPVEPVLKANETFLFRRKAFLINEMVSMSSGSHFERLFIFLFIALAKASFDRSDKATPKISYPSFHNLCETFDEFIDNSHIVGKNVV